MNSSEKNNSELGLSIVDMIFVLLKKWWIILVSAVVVGALFFTYFFFIVPPVYISNARILLGREEDPRDTTTSFTINTLNIATNLTKEFSILIKEPIVLDPVAKALDPNMSAKDIPGAISISTPGNELRILDISVSASTPEMAYKINNEIINQCEVILPSIHKHAKIDIIVTSPASVPTSSSGPNVKIYTALGALLGMVLSAIAVLMFDMVVRNKANSSLNDAVAVSDPVEPEPIEAPKATQKENHENYKKKTTDTETDK